MKFPGIPENEEERLKSVYMIDLLDTRDDERFERLTRIGQKLFQVPIAAINLLDRDRQWTLACQGLSGREMKRDISFCGHAILQKEPLIISDARLDERFHDNPLVTGEPFIRFYAGYPVHLPDGSVAGTLCLVNSEPRVFTEQDIASLKDLAFIVEDEFQIINMAMTDSLTDIPNRRGFYHSGEKRFSEFQQSDKALSILYFDLDKFKPINDMWGHAEGDEVLKVFSAQLRKLLGPKDIVGRLGGDEFAVLLASGNEPATFLNRLRESLNAFNQHTSKPYNINYSYGVISASPGKYASLNEMIKESDSVMYSEKRRKKLG
ncbi:MULTISPECIES: sensor domain-containing diguanylate cyclase [Pantoea]|uniref:Sensor domain-containing diguanylate cyclase n=1 Tax=Pantoea piersonii TaxID=2364647 RepID=A0AAJ5QP17_9GAMM|nr:MULTISPECIES: sensor domain-containing diguanylate cyclase [Pantoea]MDU6431462.1 sensor domain-containing diguanylate cyclase [Pantoea sp.]MBZ6384434.1 sensor domain-containing diguanylate cyclase [Pantoea piersonii]MBZ6399039.1 sensor domain-containing diguanylate cyclase [Pantoea piersonii]MBZ6406305.1 sensor domain-containing diguanylate cyclase [Pantoea piersonii]MBZ6425051.1 sensor domain-containing diguanylate cyclase [Pantoea piersonii]